MKLVKMIAKFLDKVLPLVAKFSVLAFVVGMVVWGSYTYGYREGYVTGESDTWVAVESQIAQASVATYNPNPTSTPATPQETQTPTNRPVYVVPSWTGPELWEVVNNKRIEYGVNPLANQSELCTIASIRLNQLLEIGKLDAHEGFSKLPDEREDLLWIFEKYNLSEFLVSGAESAEDAASLWENTLGHKKLLTGGEYVWGCIYGQNGFGVAITGY